MKGTREQIVVQLTSGERILMDGRMAECDLMLKDQFMIISHKGAIIGIFQKEFIEYIAKWEEEK